MDLLTIQYIIHSMVGQSIASLSDLGVIFTPPLCALVNMAPQVEYIGYGAPYHTMYKTCVNKIFFKNEKAFRNGQQKKTETSNSIQHFDTRCQWSSLYS